MSENVVSKVDRKSLNALIRAAELEMLHPIGFSARVLGPVPDSNVPVAISVTAEVEPGVSDDGFRFALHLVVTVRREDSDAPFARFVYEVMASYRAPRELFEGEALRLAYAEHMTIVQAWPYVRAFVQSSSASMAIPMVLLPIIQAGSLRLAVKSPSAADVEKEEARSR